MFTVTTVSRYLLLETVYVYSIPYLLLKGQPPSVSIYYRYAGNGRTRNPIHTSCLHLLSTFQPFSLSLCLLPCESQTLVLLTELPKYSACTCNYTLLIIEQSTFLNYGRRTYLLDMVSLSGCVTSLQVFISFAFGGCNVNGPWMMSLR